MTSSMGNASTRFLVPRSCAEPGYPQVAILLFEQRAGSLQVFFWNYLCCVVSSAPVPCTISHWFSRILLSWWFLAPPLPAGGWHEIASGRVKQEKWCKTSQEEASISVSFLLSRSFEAVKSQAQFVTAQSYRFIKTLVNFLSLSLRCERRLRGTWPLP